MRFSYILAVLIALAAAAWIISGDNWQQAFLASAETRDEAPSIADKMTSEDGEKADRLTAVRVAWFDERAHERAILVRGRTEALRTVLVRAGSKGRITALPVDQGDAVRKGEVLARLEMDDLNHRLKEARALVKQRELEFQAARKLGKKGYRAETNIAAAAAQLDAAKAYVAQIEVAIGKTTIRAPFDAVVDIRHAELGDYMEARTEIITLVDEDPFLAVAQVSEDQVMSLQVGAPGYAMLGDDRVMEGKIRFISRIADAATRTFRVELEIPNPDGVLRDGLTAELSFPLSSIRAHAVPPALLTLNAKGDLGLRGIEGKNRVVFYPVNVVEASNEGMWVSGLPARARLITVGNEFVRHGDSVRIVEDN